MKPTAFNTVTVPGINSSKSQPRQQAGLIDIKSPPGYTNTTTAQKDKTVYPRPINRHILIASLLTFLLIFLISAFTAPSFAAVHHAGATLGSFDVDDQGAANYTIPLDVPPGISGMQPDLALVYNSQSGNGLLGMGWSLSGLSVIHRCSQTLAQDGQIRGVDFSANDKFCLDGQRLVLESGAYGADGAEYRTEMETYSKIVSNGVAGSGPASFTVWTKAGQKMEFGNTPDSFINANIAATGTARDEANIWAVNKIRDTVGNDITFSYFEDSANGYYRIDRIDYGYTSTGPKLSVRFATEPRSDITTGYIAGSKARAYVEC